MKPLTAPKRPSVFSGFFAPEAALSDLICVCSSLILELNDQNNKMIVLSLHDISDPPTFQHGVRVFTFSSSTEKPVLPKWRPKEDAYIS